MGLGPEFAAAEAAAVGLGDAGGVAGGDGAAQPARRANSRPAASVFIVEETVRVEQRLRKQPWPGLRKIDESFLPIWPRVL